MAQLFSRRVKVIIAKAPGYGSQIADAVEIEGLRVQFKVDKTLKKEPNRAEIQITNLSEQSRASFQTKGRRVLLSAGYDKTLAQIFSGDVTSIDHRREGSDWVTTIRCGDGERAYMHARTNESFKGGTRKKDVVSRIAGSLGLDLGNIQAQLASIQGEHTQGYSSRGRASRELDRVVTAAGFEWSIQDGQLQLLRETETLGAAIVLSPDTGMIGSPEFGTPDTRTKKSLLKVRSLLQPTLKPGCQVTVESEVHRGPLKVLQVHHSGDTAGGDWYTEVEAQPL